MWRPKPLLTKLVILTRRPNLNLDGHSGALEGKAEAYATPINVRCSNSNSVMATKRPHSHWWLCDCGNVKLLLRIWAMSKPHQIWPGGKAGKEGEKAGKRQTQFQTKEEGYVRGTLN